MLLNKTTAGIKNCLCKVTTVLTFVIVSFSVTAQIKPSTGEERQKGMAQRNMLEQNSLLKDVQFRNIGPTIMSGRVSD